MEALGLIVCSLILTVSETQQLWPGVERGNVFFLCRAKVHNLTLAASTQLHNLEHVKNEAGDRNKKRGKREEEKKKGGSGGKEAR